MESIKITKEGVPIINNKMKKEIVVLSSDKY